MSTIATDAVERRAAELAVNYSLPVLLRALLIAVRRRREQKAQAGASSEAAA